jgi:signal transduction histidine kinase
VIQWNRSNGFCDKGDYLSWNGSEPPISALFGAAKKAFSPPVFSGDVKRTDRAQVVNFALLSSVVYLILTLPVYLIDGTTRSFVSIVLVALLAVVCFLYFIFRRGHVEWAGGFLILMIYLGIVAVQITNGTIRSPATVAHLFVVISAGIIFEWPGMVVTVVACSLAMLGLLVAENSHLLPEPDHTATISNWFTYTFLFVVLGSITAWTHKSIRYALERAQGEIDRRTALETVLVSEIVEREQTEVVLSKEIAMKDRLFAILAHDLRGSIGNLSSTMALITSQKVGNAEREELLLEGDGSARQAYALVENLLDWISSQSAGVEVQRASFRVGEVLQIVCEWMNPASLSKGVALQIECPEDLTIVNDEKILETILRNFVSNAIKYSPPGSTIKLRGYEEEGGSVVVSVVDQGVGITPETLGTLFGFEKVLSTDGTNREKGTGLGLMFSADLARVAGGHLRVESVLGTGSTFSFVHAAPQRAGP